MLTLLVMVMVRGFDCMYLVSEFFISVELGKVEMSVSECDATTFVILFIWVENSSVRFG